MVFHAFPAFAMAGTTIVVLVVVYAALGYRGKQGERYSFLNHFISELGEVGVSRQARVFNAGLVLGGLLLLPSVVCLGVILQSAIGWVGVFFGSVASLGVIAVGLFPMNDPERHSRAAFTFFRGGLAMVFVFGLAILFQPAGRVAIPKAASLLNLLAVLSFALFLYLPPLLKAKRAVESPPDLQPDPARRRFFLEPFLEWLVFFVTIFWLFGMAFFV